MCGLHQRGGPGHSSLTSGGSTYAPQVLLVAGGEDRGLTYLSSVEVLCGLPTWGCWWEGWRQTTPLPSARWVHGTTWYNMVYMQNIQDVLPIPLVLYPRLSSPSPHWPGLVCAPRWSPPWCMSPGASPTQGTSPPSWPGTPWGRSGRRWAPWRAPGASTPSQESVWTRCRATVGYGSSWSRAAPVPAPATAGYTATAAAGAGQTWPHFTALYVAITLAGKHHYTLPLPCFPVNN